MSRFTRWFERLAHPDLPADLSGVPEDLRRVARVAAEAAPQLGRVPGLAAKLADAAAVSLDYARTLADELGEPVALEKGVWDANPLIPVISPSPEQAVAILRSADALRRVFADPAAGACHFLLAMQRRESATFGYEQQGEVLHKDVLQTAVSFENHRVIAAARTGQEVREQFVGWVLRHLAGVVPANLERAGRKRTELGEQLTLLKSERRTLELELRQEDPYSDSRRGMESTLRALTAQEAELEAELAGLPAPPAGDEDFLAQVRQVLLHPQAHLGREKISMRVKEFGVLVRDRNSRSGRKISFAEFTPGNEPAFAVFFARLGRSEAARLWPDLPAGPSSPAGTTPGA